ncbi:MAG: hypothetical protein ACFN40_07750 [Bacteroidota bacterium]
MTTKAKTILSSLYETGGSPCGRVFECHKQLINNTLYHISTIITISQLCSRAGCYGCDFSKNT